MSEKKSKKRHSDKVGKEDLTLTAYNAIRKMLLFNEIAIGQKIHYPDIAKTLEMSPTPVIQALKWMQFQGLVRHEKNQGFYLEDISIEDVELLYQIRLSIETMLLRRSMQRLDEAGIQRLKSSLDEFLEANRKKQPKIRILKDIEFHKTLASLSGGRHANLILQHIFDLLYLKYRTYLLMLDSGRKGHQEIFDLIENRDEQGAVDALTQHIQGVCSDIVKQLEINLEEKKVLKEI
jgi:DNA-binding GntR family transcriptional regulator